MNYKLISPGDRVIDPLDMGRVRTVKEVRPYDDTIAAVFMEDGGVMGSDEIDRVYLESEEITVAMKLACMARAGIGQ